MSKTLERMKEVLSEVLGVDPADITENSNLINDLAAESIDFIDITFQISTEFGIPDVKPGSLFPAFLKELDQANIFVDGKIDSNISLRLKADFPFLEDTDITRFEEEKSFEVFFDVSILVKFVDHYTAVAV